MNLLSAMESLTGQFKSISENGVGSTRTKTWEARGPTECRPHPQNRLPSKSVCQEIKSMFDNQSESSSSRKKSFVMEKKVRRQAGHCVGTTKDYK